MSQHCSEDYFVQINVNPEEDDFEDIDAYYNSSDILEIHVDPQEDNIDADLKIKRIQRKRNNTARIKIVRKYKTLIRRVIKKNIKRHSQQVCRCNYRRCLGKGWRRPFENGPSCRIRTISMYKQKIKIGEKNRLVHIKNSSREPVPQQYSDVQCRCNSSHCLGIGEPRTSGGGPRFYYKK